MVVMMTMTMTVVVMMRVMRRMLVGMMTVRAPTVH